MLKSQISSGLTAKLTTSASKLLSLTLTRSLHESNEIQPYFNTVQVAVLARLNKIEACLSRLFGSCVEYSISLIVLYVFFSFSNVGSRSYVADVT